ncbi:MAG: hypothetical protein PHN56_04490, partial [Candidatus Nanoarchaeia archaeon]|nr:hypothetical protein [Candidatus Nanoarchaeia archaeon]
MSLDSEILKVYNERNEELSKRIDFGLKYSLLNTKEYQKYMNQLTIDTYDSSHIYEGNLIRKVSKLDFSYEKLSKKGLDFKEYYNNLKNKNYLEKIEYINSVNASKDIMNELNVLKGMYIRLIDTLDYLKSDKPNKEMWSSLETSITEENREHYMKFLVQEDLRNKNISKYFEKIESPAKFIDSLILDKASFEKVYFHGNKTKVIEDIITAVICNSERNYMPKEVMSLIESKYNFLSFSESNNVNKIFINEGTFKKIWYNVKNKIKSDEFESALSQNISKNDLLESLSFFVNDSLE